MLGCVSFSIPFLSKSKVSTSEWWPSATGEVSVSPPNWLCFWSGQHCPRIRNSYPSNPLQASGGSSPSFDGNSPLSVLIGQPESEPSSEVGGITLIIKTKEGIKLAAISSFLNGSGLREQHNVGAATWSPFSGEVSWAFDWKILPKSAFIKPSPKSDAPPLYFLTCPNQMMK